MKGNEGRRRREGVKKMKPPRDRSGDTERLLEGERKEGKGKVGNDSWVDRQIG